MAKMLAPRALRCIQSSTWAWCVTDLGVTGLIFMGQIPQISEPSSV